MSDDRRALSCIGELAREERTDHARIVTGHTKLHIAACEIGVKARVDNELNGLFAQLADRRDYFVRELAGTCVDYHGALPADLYSNVAAVANQHVHIPLHRQHMNLAIVRI